MRSLALLCLLLVGSTSAVAAADIEFRVQNRSKLQIVRLEFDDGHRWNETDDALDPGETMEFRITENRILQAPFCTWPADQRYDWTYRATFENGVRITDTFDPCPVGKKKFTLVITDEDEPAPPPRRKASR